MEITGSSNRDLRSRAAEVSAWFRWTFANTPIDWRAMGIVSSAISICVIAMVLQSGYAAFQDFGEWVYSAAKFRELVLGETGSAVVQFVPYPVPNTLAQLLLGIWVILAGPSVGPICYLLFYSLAAGLAVGYFVKRFDLSPVVASLFLCSTAVLGSGFSNGYIAHQLGIVLIIVYCALPHAVSIRRAVLILFSMLTFFTHAIIFGCWVILALVRAAYFRKGRRFLLCLIPALLMTVWYVSSTAEGKVSGRWSFGGIGHFVAYKGYTAAKLGPYQQMIGRNLGDTAVSPAVYYVGVLVNIVFVLIVLLILARWFRLNFQQWRDFCQELVMVGMLVSAALVLPPFFVGVVNPGERILCVAAVVLCPLILKELNSNVLLRRFVLCVVVLGFFMTSISLGTIVVKRAEGVELSARPTSLGSREGLLFGHRTDSFEDRVDEAESGNLASPLDFETSFLENE